ncbi:MAG: hypothetical protein EA350_12480 [Gemmatimonadales bacterium]|nr:MAG: hypothetical protein EA350_12480 [Gemmatimonadales bacterium]
MLGDPGWSCWRRGWVLAVRTGRDARHRTCFPSGRVRAPGPGSEPGEPSMPTNRQLHTLRATCALAFALGGCGSGGGGGAMGAGATGPGASGHPSDGFETEVSFPSGDVRLVGTLTVPPGNGPVPAVILLSGSGPQDREGETAGFVPGYQPSRVLAERLAEAGIASLRYDERGVGASTGSHASASTADLADDAEAALSYLRSREGIAPARVGLLGQSEGASIAAMVAARNPDVAFVVSLAGPAVKGHDLVLAQSEHALRNSGLSGPDLEAAMAGVRREYDLVLNEEWEGIEAAMRAMLPAQLEAMPPEQRALLGTPEEIMAEELLRMKNWTRFFLTYDPARDWARIRVPVLALLGGLDVQVTVEQNRAPLEAALRAAPTEDWTVRVLPSANHLFQDAETGNPDEYFRLDPVIASEVLDAVATWIRERVGRQP